MAPHEILAKQSRPKNLSFYHTHTGEQFELYIDNGQWAPRYIQKLSTFLRDFRTGDIHLMDIKLFDALHKIQLTAGNKGVYEVISGYRSPKTNEGLRAKSNGVAKESYHMKGQAIDVRLSGLRTKDLRDIARDLRTGGVGYYQKSDFIHLDTGPVRFW